MPTVGSANNVYTYNYDNRGLKILMGGSIDVAYTYDALGRVTRKTHDGQMPLTYTYDAASRLTRLTHPDGFVVDYGYNTLGEPVSAAAGTTTLATVTYDDLGRRSSVAYGNGTSSSYGYDGASRLDELDWDFANTADDIAYDFTYSPASQTLTKSVMPKAMIWSPTSAATDAYVVNGLNQYTSVAGNTVTHSAAGNITTDHRGHDYTYDADNRLLEVKDTSDATLKAYLYYAEGNLRWTTGDNRFYYDDTQEIAEYHDPGSIGDGDATLLRRYVRLPGSVDEPFLMIDYTLAGSCTATSFAPCTVYAHQNRLGSVVATTDDSGNKLDTYTYSPYGESGPEGNTGFPFRFTGQKLDATTGLYYYKARFYDTQTGRFLQTDPIGYEDQMNLYAYVGNDPVNAWDPSGEKSDIGERRDRHERAVRYAASDLRKEGYIVHKEVTVDIYNDDGELDSQRRYDIVAVPRGRNLGDVGTRYIEIKTYARHQISKRRDRKKRKKYRSKISVGDIIRAVQAKEQYETDREFAWNGGEIKRNGRMYTVRAKGAEPRIEWWIYLYNGRSRQRKIPRKPTHKVRVY